MNEFIQLKEAARKSGAISFKYTRKDGKTIEYTRGFTKNGLVVYYKKNVE